jgi:hypothetical protein
VASCFFANTPLKLGFLSSENIISLPHSLGPEKSQKKCALGIDLGSSNGVEASDLLKWGFNLFLNSPLEVYLPICNLQEVELGEADLLTGAVGGTCCRASSCGAS